MSMMTLVFDPLDEAVKKQLLGTTLYDLVTEAEKQRDTQGFMFFI